MSTFLERSSVLRVDMLTAWIGLFSLLFLLDRRFVISGALAGLSFLVSQKGLYFNLAAAAALLGQWLLVQRNRQAFLDGIAFACASAATIGGYLVAWAQFSSFASSTPSEGERPLVIAERRYVQGEITLQELEEIKTGLGLGVPPEAEDTLQWVSRP